MGGGASHPWDREHALALLACAVHGCTLGWIRNVVVGRLLRFRAPILHGGAGNRAGNGLKVTSPTAGGSLHGGTSLRG